MIDYRPGFLSQCVAFCVLALLAPLMLAQAPQQRLDHYPQATRVSVADIISPGHLVMLSPVREIRGEIRSETMARMPVTGSGQLLEISEDASRKAARDHYLQELQALGGKVLFDCSGMACGRNNVWANQVFQQPGLVGPDSTQDYFAAAYMDENGDQWLVLVYTVTRGNLREYVWVEQLKVARSASIPGLQSASGRMLGPVIVSWQGTVTHRFDLSVTNRRQLAEWAGEEGSEVVLAAFSELGPEQSFDDALVQARRAGDSLAELLGKTGVPSEQIRVLAIGPGVQTSVPGRDANRIEVLVIRRQR